MASWFILILSRPSSMIEVAQFNITREFTGEHFWLCIMLGGKTKATFAEKQIRIGN